MILVIGCPEPAKNSVLKVVLLGTDEVFKDIRIQKIPLAEWALFLIQFIAFWDIHNTYRDPRELCC